jgi:flagellar basal body-associated protein FliL
MSARKKIMITLIVILLLLTAGVYGYGVYYFTELLAEALGVKEEVAK